MISEWKTIDSAPEGEMLLMFCPGWNRGGPGMEVLMLFRDERLGTSYWTNGGPNAGDDIAFPKENEPTHWMALPPEPEL